MTYRITRKSNYEGFKSLEAMQQKIAEGKLKPPREGVSQYTCGLCRLKVRAVQLMPSRLMGASVEELLPKATAKMVGKFVLACPDCVGRFGKAVA